MSSLARLRHVLGDWLEGLGAASDDRQQLELAAYEAMANAAEHAYRPDGPARSGPATWQPDGYLAMAVTDQRRWRDPDPGK